MSDAARRAGDGPILRRARPRQALRRGQRRGALDVTCCAASTSTCGAARRSPSSAPRARARARCSICWAGSKRRRSGTVLLCGRDFTTLERARAGRMAQPPSRLRLPVPSPAAGIHGARQRRDAAAHPPRSPRRGARARGRGAGPGRPRRAAAASPVAALRRRAAARRDRALVRRAARLRARRRADRQPRPRHRRRACSR